VLAPAAAGIAPAEPRVGVSDVTPVTLRGANFQPGEQVVVGFAAGKAAWRQSTVTADAAGSFVVVFRNASVRRCNGYRARARGDLGSRATYERSVRCVIR
jgi:hypothetical protein